MMKNKSTYEIMSPEYIGLTRADESGIVLGQASTISPVAALSNCASPIFYDAFCLGIQLCYHMAVKCSP